MNDQYNPYNYISEATKKASGVYDWSQWQEQERQRHLQEEILRGQRLIQNDAIKAQNRSQIHIYEFQEKERLKERNRELRRAQYEALSISETGEVIVETKNLQIESLKRSVCNFVSPGLEVLYSFGDENERIFRVFFCLRQKHKEIFLLPDLLGSGTYLLKKFNSVGASIMGTTLAQEKKYVKELVRLLVENCSCSRAIPNQRGLICEKKREPIFVGDEVLIWQDYVKRSR